MTIQDICFIHAIDSVQRRDFSEIIQVLSNLLISTTANDIYCSELLQCNLVAEFVICSSEKIAFQLNNYLIID